MFRRGLLGAVVGLFLVVGTAAAAPKPPLQLAVLAKTLDVQVRKHIEPAVPEYDVRVWVDHNKRRLQVQYSCADEHLEAMWAGSAKVSVAVGLRFKYTVAEIWDPVVTPPPKGPPNVHISYARPK